MHRVNVIATGFGDLQQKRSKPVSAFAGNTSHSAHSAPSTLAAALAPNTAAGNDDRRLDIPTFTRRAQATAPDTAKIKKLSVVASAEDEEKYEIPTFLRRQVD